MLGFPGFGQGSSMPGDDPVIPQHLLGGHMAERAADIQAGVQKVSLLSGDVENKVAMAVQGVLTGVAETVLKHMQQATGTTGQSVDLRPYVAGTPAGHAASKTPAPLPAPPAPEAKARPEPEQHTPTFTEQYKEGRERISHMTMGSVAKAAAAPAARYFSERQGGWVRTDPNDPNALNALPNGEQGMYRLSEDGMVGGDGTLASGQVLDAVAESSPGYGALARRSARSEAIAGNLSRFAAGEGLAGTLGTVATRVAGPIGLAVGAAQTGGAFLEKQHAAAAHYRSAFGEDTGMFAAGDRGREWLAGIEGFGTIGGERARDQFRQASALGLRGERREGAEDFATDMFMKFGMDTSESMEIVRRSVEQGNISLTQFSEAITEVSRSAVEAGRSSKEAIEDFTAAQNVVATNIVGGDASLAVTEQITAVTSGMDRSLVKGLGGAEGLAGAMTPTNVMGMAAMSGQSPMAAYGAMMSPATAPTQIADTLAQMGIQIATMAAQQLGMSLDDLKAAVNEKTGGKPVSEDQMAMILTELAGGQEQYGMLIMMLTQYIQRFLGVAVDPAQVLNTLSSALAGGFGMTSEVKEGIGRGAKAIGKMGKGFGSIFGKPGKGDTSKDDLLADMGYAPARTSSENYMGQNLTGENVFMGRPSETPEDSEAFDAYYNLVNKTGKRNKQVEALLSPENQDTILDKAGVGSIEDVKYRINGKDMSLTDIISSGKPGYLKQLASGQAGIVPTNETDNPASVGDVTGIRIDLSSEARRLLRVEGPSDEQRRGVPSPRYTGTPTSPYGGP
jgi:hypothetical protein